MDSKFLVYYFPYRASSETIRLILSYVGANWDNQIIINWEKEKYNTQGLLFHQVPMLIEKIEHEKEFRLVQSNAIVKYLTDKFDLASNDIFKNALLQSYYEGLAEIKIKVLNKLFHSQDLNNISDEFKKPDSFISLFLENNEKILYGNGANGHYMDNKITYVDIEAMDLVDCVNDIPGLKDFIGNHNAPNLMKVYNNVSSNSNIISYKNSAKRLSHCPFHLK